jgi:hypothetical protein
MARPPIDLFVEVFGRNPLVDPTSVRAVMAAMEQEVPVLAPTRWGEDERVRQRWPGADAGPTEALAYGRTGFTAKGGKPGYAYWEAASPAVTPDGRQLEAHSQITLRAASSAVGDDADAVVRLLERMALAVSADFGFVQVFHPSEFKREKPRRFVREFPDGGDPVIGLPARRLEFFLPDVMWGTVLGPAYVELFGADRIRSAPAHQVVELASDLWYLQATERLPDCRDDPQRVGAVRDAVKDHLGREAFARKGQGFRVPAQRRARFAPRSDEAEAQRASVEAAEALAGDRGPLPAQPPAPSGGSEPAAAAPAELVDAVRVYRRAGLFADSARTDEAVAVELAERHEDEWGEPLVPPPADRPAQLTDILIMAADPTRVWWDDTEADVVPGNDAYVALVGELAAISGGAFAPVEVVERWDGEDGPVGVSITTSDGRRVEVSPRVDGEWLDVGSVVDGLNRLLPATGRRFWRADTGDQTALVASLTDTERSIIEAGRPLRLTPTGNGVTRANPPPGRQATVVERPGPSGP